MWPFQVGGLRVNVMLHPESLSVSLLPCLNLCGSQVSLDPAAEGKPPAEPQWYLSLQADFLVC